MAAPSPSPLRRACGTGAFAAAAIVALAAVAVGSAAAAVALGIAVAAGLGVMALWLPSGRRSANDAPPATPLAAAVDAVAPRSARDDPDLQQQIEALRSTQAELLLAKQASEAAALAKDEFLATMSHEIRTPLNGVLPLLELVLSTPLNADQREHLATAFRSAQEMLRIVDDILDYSKLDVGKVELESIGLNLRELVDGVAQLMRRSAEAKGLQLTVAVDANVRLAVRGDPVRLRQVLMNLVSNAIKFTTRGGVSILLSRRGESATRHEIAFIVRDTGIGIAADAAARLFQPFAQGDASITRAFGGTGLGLVICKRLIDLMGGQIGVQSDVGKGSMFWFSVPLLKVVGDLPAQSGLQDRRALLVGADEPALRRLLSALRSAGLQIEAVATPTDALNKLHANVGMGARWRYDLVVVDAAEFPNRLQGFVRSVLGDAALSQLRVLVLAVDDAGNDGFAGQPRVASLARGYGDPALRAALDGLFDVVAEAPAERPSLGRSARPAAAPAPSATRLRYRGNVLLVEDNPVNLQVAQRLLSLYGLRVDTAGNGEEALRRLANSPYDLILMDCQMPVLDGHSATRQWRALERERAAKPTPIVAMTANAMAGDRERCLASGMDDYLSKPLSRATLEQTLGRWLGAGDAAPTAPVAAAPPSPETPPRRPVAAVAATPASPTPPALDGEIVRELAQMMGADFAGLVDVYVDETPAKITELEIAAIHGDAPTMIAQAHSLKSSSANLGASRLAELARQVEEGLRAEPSRPMQDAVQRIRAEFVRVAGALEDVLARGTAR